MYSLKEKNKCSIPIDVRCRGDGIRIVARLASPSDFLGPGGLFFFKSSFYVGLFLSWLLFLVGNEKSVQFCGCMCAIPQYPADDVEPVPSDWLVSDQEEELIRLLIVDSDYAEP